MLSREQQLLVERGVKSANLTVSAYLNRYRQMRPFKDDIRQDAYMALVQAAKTFDPSRGCAFSAYACTGIRFHLAAKAPDYLHALRRTRAYAASSDGEESIPDEGVDPTESLVCMDAAPVSVRVRERVKAVAGERNEAVWWRVVMQEDSAAEAGKCFGLCRERARQIVDQVNALFFSVTADIRAEAC